MPERAPSEEEQAYMDVGATKVSSLLSKGLWKEGEKERGSRQFGHMEDILDDDLDAQEAFAQEIHTQATGRCKQLYNSTPLPTYHSSCFFLSPYLPLPISSSLCFARNLFSRLTFHYRNNV